MKSCILFFWLHCEAYGVLVPQSAIKSILPPTPPPAVEVGILNHWTAKKVLTIVFFEKKIFKDDYKKSFKMVG